MDQPETIEFKVDEQYENEKGVFTVVSIHRDEMVIRWENGEEIRTGIALQRRIAERRQWEEQQRLAAAEAARKPSRKSAKKTVFTGLAPTDFKKSASGTTWRSRNQLGAAVAQKIVTTRLKLNSWAFGNKPEMHVQDTKHHNQGEADYQAKFFVRVDQQALHYGFRVARPETKDGASSDWSRFYEWLAQPENEQTLRTIAIENKMAVSNLASPSLDTLIASEDGWRIDASTPQPDQATLNGYINDTPEPKPLDLALVASMAKDDVVACGPDIATKIAQLFTQIVPLYLAAVTH